MNRQSRYIFISLFILLLLLVWKPGVAGSIFGPLISLAAIVLLSKYLYLSFGQSNLHEPVSASPSISVYAVWLLLMSVSCGWLWQLYQANPIDITKSDILPLIRDVYCNRLLHGESVYAMVSGYDYVYWTPNYLPFHWLPFIPSILLGIDMRFTILIIFILIQFYYLRVVLRFNNGLERWIKICLPFVILFSLLLKQPLSIAHNVELLIVSYYILLAIGMVSDSVSVQIAGWTSTLLSRYMSVFALPTAAASLLRSRDRKQLYVVLGVAALLLLTYILPFFLRDPGIFSRGAAAYDAAALGEWRGQSWQAAGDRPYQLFQGYGFASWIYLYGSGTLTEKITMFKYLLLAIMGVMSLVGLWITWRTANRYMPLFWLFLSCALFPFFSLVPYNYLYWELLFLIPVMLIRVRILK